MHISRLLFILIMSQVVANHVQSQSDKNAMLQLRDTSWVMPTADSINYHYTLAIELFNAHDDTGESLEEAKKKFETVLSLNPYHASAIAYLGLIALEKRDLILADSLFKSSINIDSTCAEALVGRSKLSRSLGQWQAGYDEIRRAVLLAPTSILARWELVSQLLHRAEAPVTKVEVNEAIPHLKKIIELDSNNRQAHLDLAESYEELNQLKEAVFHYREVLRIGQIPEDMDIWVYEIHKDVARCLEKMQEYLLAANELRIYLDILKNLEADERTINETKLKIHELGKKAKK